MLAGLFSCSTEEGPARVLVFSKTAGFRHSSIPAGQAALLKMGQEHGFVVDTTEDASNFNEENLKRYKAVVFLSTTGDVLNPEQQNNFERYVEAGGGFLGIHAATDTEYDWPWYGKLVGAYFESHPNNPNVKKGTFLVVDKTNPATTGLPERWEREDEFYNFKQINPDIKVLVTIDEKSYEGGTNGEHHPMSWFHEYAGGRSFYTSIGHTDESFSEPLVLQHLWGGLNYVLGGDEPKPLDYEKVRTPRMPEENRFTKVVLDEKLEEPMELTVLKDGRVLFIERRGNVKLYSPKTGKVKVIATIPVSTKYVDKEGKEKEAEDGLLGLAQDPNFEKNNWIYLFYSAAGDEAKNILTRYEMRGDELLLDSKKVLLEIPVQREECCHTGGSIAFDAQGNLYLSTGDNTNPHASNGFSPSDERPGRNSWDAQKSSANTNDLRGKIIRIHPEDDGTYTIPEGNLFPKGTAKTRPEIYTMGHRNPFRISVDQKTGFVYWGEVGPDSKEAAEDRGPEGFDEVGQARKAGNFGWPHFIGDNKAYNKYDFAAGKSGAKFDVNKPVNTSPNNTGLNELPPAQSAFIWYPYAESKEFPLVGSGGRNAMAGPVYYQDQFKNASRAFPSYYDGKLFIYDWMRGWIMAVTMDKEGNFVSMEQFMPSHKFSNPMDMAFSPEGDLYMLEYGTGWFQGNDDARLVKIEYNGGNRKPVVEVMADKQAGALPMKVALSSEGTHDYDHDELDYKWTVTSATGTKQAFSEANPSVTLDKAGVYKATLTVTDTKGESSSKSLELQAGNEPPALAFEVTQGNKTFFFPGQTIAYEVKVIDKEDGSLATGKIKPEQVAVTIDYLPEGFDKVAIAMGHRSADASAQLNKGLTLIEGSDCKACHGLDKKSIGPSYKQVALKYKGDKAAADQLVKKVISGGSGVWGEVSMSAHPQLSQADAREMVNYILSLSEEKAASPSLPVKGTYTTALPEGDKGVGVYMLRAAYQDKGANGIKGLASEQNFILRNPNVPASKADAFEGIQKYKLPNGMELVIASASGSHIAFKNVDMSGINQLTFSAMASKEYGMTGGTIEVRLGSPDGELLGQSDPIMATSGAGPNTPPQQAKASLKSATGFQDLYLVFKNDKAASGQMLFTVLNVLFENNGAGSRRMAVVTGGK
nr:ThuA domain-containing protein [Pontibacter ummariensis]